MKPNNQFKVRQIVGITMLKYVIGFMDSKVISNTLQIILIQRNTFYHRYEIFFISSSLATISTQNHEERKSEVVMSDCLEKQA